MEGYKSAVVALLSSLVTAIALAYVFKFPTFGGVIGPFGDKNPYASFDLLFATPLHVLLFWLAFGFFGLFIGIGLAGAVAWLIGEITGMSSRNMYYLAATFGGLPMLYLALYN